MAGSPPGLGGPGLPPGPPPGPPGPPPPQPPAPPPGPPGGAAGLGPGAPFGGASPSPNSTIFVDLSVDMTDGWQMIDMGIRCLKTALKTPEFQKTELGKVNAVIRVAAKNLTTLVAHYTSGGKPGGASVPKLGEDTSGEAGSVTSPDADAAPEDAAG